MHCRVKAPSILNKEQWKHTSVHRLSNTTKKVFTSRIHTEVIKSIRAVPVEITFLVSNYTNLARIPLSSFSTSRLRNIMTSGPIQQSIEQKLREQLNPSHLEVINESYMHNVPKGSESHFKVVIVSDAFEQMSLLQKHRTVNEILEHELKTGVHALSIQAKTPQQWEQSNHQVSQSPACLGGMVKEKKQPT